MWQKSEPLITYSIGENAGETRGRCGTTSAETYLSKPKMHLPFHPAILLLGIYLKDITSVQSDMYTRLFIVLLFIIAKILETT